MIESITARQFHEADGVEDWRVVGEGACTYFRTGSFTRYVMHPRIAEWWRAA